MPATGNPTDKQQEEKEQEQAERETAREIIANPDPELPANQQPHQKPAESNEDNT